MSNISLDLTIVGIILGVYIVIFASIMAYLEEKKKCNHIWKTIDIQNWNSSRHGEYLKVIQECTKCGKIQIIEA